MMVSMDDVRRKHSGHWFDPDTLRFFRSRVGSTAHESEDRRYRFFVSSEQFRYTDPYTYREYRDARRYSVRVQGPDGSIDTVGEFQGYSSSRAANNAAKGYALDPASACSLRTGDGGSCPIHDEWHGQPSTDAALDRVGLPR
jgi:hypothetical protein